MEVDDGNHQTRKGENGWTLDHHKQFLESVVRNGGLSIPKITELVIADMPDIRPFTVLFHMNWFRIFHMLNESLIKKLPEFDSLVREFAGLGVRVEGAKMSRPSTRSWTVEDYKEVVEAIIKLGGLGGGDATPGKVLELVDSRFVGLTEKILEQILSRLQNLQERTRRTWRDHGGPLLPRRQCTWVRPVLAHPYARKEIIMGESSWGRAIRNNPERIKMYSISFLEQVTEVRAQRSAQRRAKIIEKRERMESLVTKMDNINLGGGSSGST